MSPPRSADSLQAALDRVFADPAYHWTSRPDPWSWLRRWWELASEWLRAVQVDHPTWYWLLLLLLIGALAAIFVHLIVVAVRTAQYATAADASRSGPAAPARDAAWFLAQADGLLREGRNVEAILAAFRALVVELAENGAVQFHPSKTPLEYLHEARLPPEQQDRLRVLVDAVYAYAFAGAPCGPADYLGWRARAREGSWRAGPE